MFGASPAVNPQLSSFVRVCSAILLPRCCAADLVPSDDPTYVGRPGSVAARGQFRVAECRLSNDYRRSLAFSQSPDMLRGILRVALTRLLSIRRHSNRKLISGDKRFIVGDDRDPVCNRHRSRCLGFRRFALHLGCLKIEQLTDL
jgi:hypothetical protein